MHNQRKRYPQVPPILFGCNHQNVLSYELSEADKADFCKRLNGILSVENGERESALNLMFLTPGIRGTRAKSLLTTRASKNLPTNASPEGADSIGNEEKEGERFTSIMTGPNASSSKKQRQNTQGGGRHSFLNSKIIAPAKFHNCADCGSFYINETISAIKPRQYCFRADILPTQLICTFFQMQKEQVRVTLLKGPDSLSGQDLYLNGRKRIIDGVYKMGVKFQQARETIHIAIEMVDQYYLTMSQEMTIKAFKAKFMHPVSVILHQVTVILISSKFDEIDDNITAIRDLREYVHKQVVQQHRKESSLIPSFNQIVECERKLLFFFGWNIKFVLPLHILRAFLANGVLFTNEFRDMIAAGKSEMEISRLKAEWSRSITTEALSISDLIVSKGNVSHRSELSSDIAASIIYLARKNILVADSPTGNPLVPQIWPQELVMITRCSESKTKRILVDILRPFEQGVNSASKPKHLSSFAPAENSANRQLQINTSGTKPHLYKQSVLSPAIATSSTQLSVEKISIVPQTTRASKLPTSLSLLKSGNGIQLTNSEVTILNQRRMAKYAPIKGALQQSVNSTQSQQQFENAANVNIHFEKAHQIVEQCSISIQDHGQEENFGRQLNKAIAHLPPRATRANTLKDCLKSTMDVHAHQQITNLKTEQSLIQNNLKTKAQSQRSLFEVSGSLESLPTNAMTQAALQGAGKERVSSSSKPRLTAPSEESDSAYGTNPLSHRLSNEQLLHIPISQHNSAAASGVKSYEKTQYNSDMKINERAGYTYTNHLNAVISPKQVETELSPELAVHSSAVVSSERRPTNNLGLDKNYQSLGFILPEQNSTDIVPLPSDPPSEATQAQMQPVHPKMHCTKRQAEDECVNPKVQLKQQQLQQQPAQAQIKSKKSRMIKQTYLDVKKAQIARNQTQRQLLKQNNEKKNSSIRQLTLPINDQKDADGPVQIAPSYPGTTKAATGGNKLPICKRPQTNLAQAPVVRNNPSTLPAAKHTMMSQSTQNMQSKDYYTKANNVRQPQPGAQAARNSSVEYESRQTHTSDKSLQRTGSNQYLQAPEIVGKRSIKQHKQLQRIQKPGSALQQQSLQPQSSQFFKRAQIRGDKGRSIGPHNNSQHPPGILQITEPADGISTEILLGTQESEPASQNQSVKQTKSSYVLPSIAHGNSDFNQAVERYVQAPTLQHKLSLTQKMPQEHQKKFSKGPNIARITNNEEQKSTLIKSHQQTSARHMLHLNGEENLNTMNHASSSGAINKNKSSIFNTQNNQQATATKSLNGGFGSATSSVPLSTKYSSQRVYGGNKQIKKGPNFNQKQLMSSQSIEQASISNYQSQEVMPSNGRIGYKNMTANQRLGQSGSSQRITQQQQQPSLSHTAQTGELSNTLQQVAADEAFIKLQSHQQAYQGQKPPAVPSSMKKQQSAPTGSNHHQNVLMRNGLQQQVLAANQRNHIGLSGSNVQQRQRDALQTKIMSVETNKTSSFLVGQQKAVYQANQFQVTRSQESMLQPSMRSNEGLSTSSLRLHKLKHVPSAQQHQDSKH